MPPMVKADLDTQGRLGGLAGNTYMRHQDRRAVLKAVCVVHDAHEAHMHTHRRMQL